VQSTILRQLHHVITSQMYVSTILRQLHHVITSQMYVCRVVTDWRYQRAKQKQ